jgi:hypothetical protein
MLRLSKCYGRLQVDLWSSSTKTKLALDTLHVRRVDCIKCMQFACAPETLDDVTTQARRNSLKVHRPSPLGFNNPDAMCSG